MQTGSELHCAPGAFTPAADLILLYQIGILLGCSVVPGAKGSEARGGTKWDLSIKDFSVSPLLARSICCSFWLYCLHCTFLSFTRVPVFSTLPRTSRTPLPSPRLPRPHPLLSGCPLLFASTLLPLTQ